MREILFRGKRKDNGEWIENHTVVELRDGQKYIPNNSAPSGLKIDENGNKVSFVALFHEVIPETVGMYVGEHINGVKVFENDIIKFFDYGENHFGVVKFGKYSASGSENIGFYVNWLDPSDSEYYRQDLGWWLEKPYVEIVGNAFDNPELVKGGAE